MTTDREAALAQFWRNREALNRERSYVGIAARPRMQVPPTVTFASAVAEKYATELKLTAADFVGFDRTGKSGFTVRDVRTVAQVRDTLAGA